MFFLPTNINITIRFLSDSIGDILKGNPKCYDIHDFKIIEAGNKVSFKIYEIINPNDSLDLNNKITIYGVI